ncbi:hypothetical protein DITRI_Ditri03aG0032700 [Diplodiscus trichospermus]
MNAYFESLTTLSYHFFQIHSSVLSHKKDPNKFYFPLCFSKQITLCSPKVSCFNEVHGYPFGKIQALSIKTNFSVISMKTHFGKQDPMFPKQLQHLNLIQK